MAFGPWNGWLAAGTIVAACPFMLSDRYCPKTAKRQSIVALFGLVAVSLCVAAEFGLL